MLRHRQLGVSMDRKDAVEVLRRYLAYYKQWPALRTMKAKESFWRDVLLLTVKYRPVSVNSGLSQAKKGSAADKKSLDDMLSNFEMNAKRIIESAIYRRPYDL